MSTAAWKERSLLIMCITENKSDERFMREALMLAREAFDLGEVPVGAVVVKDGVIIGRGKNARESTGDATAHAEVLAIREACAVLGTWRLSDCSLYVTMEPCTCVQGRL